MVARESARAGWSRAVRRLAERSTLRFSGVKPRVLWQPGRNRGAAIDAALGIERPFPGPLEQELPVQREQAPAAEVASLQPLAEAQVGQMRAEQEAALVS